MLSQGLINELGTILREDFRIESSSGDLTQIAETFVKYFGLLVQINDHKQNKEKSQFTPKALIREPTNAPIIGFMPR